MKILAAIAAVLFTASQLSAQTADKPTVITPADIKQPDTKTAPTVTTPAKTPTNTPAKKDEKKKPAPEPVIPGVSVVRTNGTMLGLEVVGGNFKLSFYDKKKKPMAVDVTRATARWPNTRSATIAFNHTVLNSSGGNALIGAKPVLPPFAWNVYITLLRGEGEEAKAVESYTVPFHG